MENRDSLPHNDSPTAHPHLHVVKSHEEQLLQIQQQRQELEERELKLKEREEEVTDRDIDLLKLKHQLGIEKFKLCAKTLVSLTALIAGFHLHMNEDSLGSFLIGSGLGGFGVTMAMGTSLGSKSDPDP
jgi:hypothetical protein